MSVGLTLATFFFATDLDFAMSKKPRKPRQRKIATLPELVATVLVPARTPGDPNYSRLGTSYQSEFSRLTKPQLEAIGRVVSNWAVLEVLLEMLLVRLAFAVAFPARALTADLGAENRIRAALTLVNMHRGGRYRPGFLDHTTLDQIADVVKVIGDLKTERNRIVHWVWSRTGGDQAFGIRHRATLPGSGAINFKKLTIEEMNGVADQIRDASDVLLVLCFRIPEIDESWLLQALAKELRPRHLDKE